MAAKSSATQAHRRSVDLDALTLIGHNLLVALGEDPEREGLKGTPLRWARAWAEFVDYDPGSLDATFESVQTDQMVVVSGIHVWSMCEHHLLPFSCEVAIGYIATDRVLGLSKFARICHLYAHGLQLQERLTEQIADDVQGFTKAEDVAVLCCGQHLCTTMRGIRTPSTMKTSVMRGAFRESPEARAEFLSIAGY